MNRSALRSFCGLALFISFLMSAEASSARNWVALDSKGNVLSFYGIPVTLTRSSLKRLPYRVKKGHHYAEGDRYTNYRITAQNRVEVVVSFERDGKLYDAWTESPNAVGFKGMGVGSTLADVKAAWPGGELLYGFEDGRFVTYVTGTNVLFRFNPHDLPPGAFDHDAPRDFPIPDNIKIRTISIHPEPNPVPKGRDPLDPNKNFITIENSDREVVSRLDVERIPGSPLVRVRTSNRKAKLDQIVDVSKYPDFDIWAMDLIYHPDPVVVSFRYGNFKNCTVADEDRDKGYLTLDGAGATMSSSPPKGVAILERQPMRKYVGDSMKSAAHGCRRTYDPNRGTFGLERDGE